MQALFLLGLTFREYHVQGPGAVDAFDSGHFDVRGGGGAGDCGDRQSLEWFHLADRFGDGFNHLAFEYYAEVVVGNQGDRAASFVWRVAQEDGSGERDGGGAGR